MINATATAGIAPKCLSPGTSIWAPHKPNADYDMEYLPVAPAISTATLNTMADDLRDKLAGCDIHELLSVMDALNGVIAQRAYEIVLNSAGTKTYDFAIQASKDARKVSDEAMRLGVWAQQDIMGL